jgi:hypothetical protein
MLFGRALVCRKDTTYTGQHKHWNFLEVIIPSVMQQSQPFIKDTKLYVIH